MYLLLLDMNLRHS